MSRLPVIALLLGLLAAAAAAATEADGAQPSWSSSLATKIAVACATGMPPASLCCRSVLFAVHLGGGVASLGRVASEPPLLLAGVSSSDLPGLFTACTQLHAREEHLYRRKR